MSRSGYNEDGDFDQWQWIRWRGRVTAATRGKRGQRLFLDLIEALDCMPEKRLIAGELIRETGEVCALGAIGLKRGVNMWPLNPEPEWESYDDEIENAEAVADAFNVATCLVQEVTYMNDEAWYRVTPEERWRRMRDWAVKQLQPVEDDSHISLVSNRSNSGNIA